MVSDASVRLKIRTGLHQPRSGWLGWDRLFGRAALMRVPGRPATHAFILGLAGIAALVALAP